MREETEHREESLDYQSLDVLSSQFFFEHPHPTGQSNVVIQPGGRPPSFRMEDYGTGTEGRP